MPFTIGEIPIGQIVDGEMVLRDVMVDMNPPGQYQPMPSTPPRGVPTRPEAPRQTTMAIGEEDRGQVMRPPPSPGGVLGKDFFLNDKGVQTNIPPIPQLPGGVRPPDYRTEAPKFTFPETTPAPRPVYGDLPSFLNAYGIGGLPPSVSGANRDPDEDGLVNGDEFSLNTDPTHPDTDSDGTPDGQEYLNGTNPLLGNGEIVDGVQEDVSSGCLENLLKAQKALSIYDWEIQIYATSDNPIPGKGTSALLPPEVQLPGTTKPVMEANAWHELSIYPDTRNLADALFNAHLTLRGAEGYALQDSALTKKQAMEMGRKALDDVKKALDSFPTLMIPVSDSGEMVMDMQLGKKKVALEYARKQLKAAESLLSSCGDPIDCPQSAPPLCPPDSTLVAIGTSGSPCWTPNYACRPKFKQNCYNVSVRKGSGTETITRCEQVLMDADEWKLMQQGRIPIANPQTDPYASLRDQYGNLPEAYGDNIARPR